MKPLFQSHCLTPTVSLCVVLHASLSFSLSAVTSSGEIIFHATEQSGDLHTLHTFCLDFLKTYTSQVNWFQHFSSAKWMIWICPPPLSQSLVSTPIYQPRTKIIPSVPGSAFVFIFALWVQAMGWLKLLKFTGSSLWTVTSVCWFLDFQHLADVFI